MLYKNRNNKQEDMTANTSKYPNGYFKDKPCKRCFTIFKPQAPSHKFCSQLCADEQNTCNYLQRTYNITLENYRQMLDKQKHLCYICELPGFKLDPRSHTLLVVDHCHISGQVRGLLCHNCNRALGLLKDDVKRLSKAITYLKSAETISEESTPK